MTAPSQGTTPVRGAGRRRVGVLASAAVLGLLLAACGGSGNAFSSSSSSSSAAGAGTADKNLTVGGGNFTEFLIMQQLYGQLLTKAGYTVNYKAVSNRELYEPALEKGEIDIVPDYAATMASFVNKKVNGTSAPDIATSDAAQTVQRMQPLLQKLGLVALDPSPAADQNAFAVTKKFAQANNLTTLSDLAKLNKPLRLAAPPECPDRPFCQPGLEKTYGLKISQLIPLPFGSAQAKQAVISGKADLVETGTVDATLDSLGLVALKDDKGLQLADNLVPVLNAKVANDQTVKDTLNKLSSTLTTEDLGKLDLQVDGQRQKPEDVAKTYLTSKGLL
jgi:osmoprotectant transport system substrate-binding protein